MFGGYYSHFNESWLCGRSSGTLCQNTPENGGPPPPLSVSRSPPADSPRAIAASDLSRRRFLSRGEEDHRLPERKSFGNPISSPPSLPWIARLRQSTLLGIPSDSRMLAGVSW